MHAELTHEELYAEARQLLAELHRAWEERPEEGDRPAPESYAAGAVAPPPLPKAPGVTKPKAPPKPKAQAPEVGTPVAPQTAASPPAPAAAPAVQAPTAARGKKPADPNKVRKDQWEPQNLAEWQGATSGPGFLQHDAPEGADRSHQKILQMQPDGDLWRPDMTAAEADVLLKQKTPVKTPPPPGGITEPGEGVARGRAHELDAVLRVAVPGFVPSGKKSPRLAASTKNDNAGRQLAVVNRSLETHPEAMSTPEHFAHMMADALQSGDVPAPPYRGIELANDPEKLAGELARLTPQQLAEANHGLENAKRFRALYTSGQATAATTAKLMLWSFLSRGVSPYIQESMFLDAVKHIGPWAEKAAADKFTDDDMGAYRAWSETVAPKGSGMPGNQSTHNLNAFGESFLRGMSEPGHSGKSKLQELHDAVASDKTGPEVRRQFAGMSEGVGIDNKVISFALLVSGRDDVMVLDRVQVRNHWDDGRFSHINLYDGTVAGEDPDEKEAGAEDDEAAAPPRKAGKIGGMSTWTAGAKGILLHEALERGLGGILAQAYAKLGRPQDASMGRYHWESWVLAGQQEASHGTIDGILREAEGHADPYGGLTAKEGRYYQYSYGHRYGRDGNGLPFVLYSDSQGRDYKMTPRAAKELTKATANPKSGIIRNPVPFKQRRKLYGDRPWQEYSDVDHGKLDRHIATLGVPVSPQGGTHE